MTATLAKEITYTGDIGMFTINRPIATSCVHKTAHCEANCYNNKLYKVYKNMAAKDARNEEAWRDNDAKGLKLALKRKRKQTNRIRLMSRGEAFSDYSDISRVANLARSLSDSLIWIPTRSWRNPLLWELVKGLAAKHDNIRLLASTDPTTSQGEWEALKAQGVSIMFFGNDSMLSSPNGDRMFKCPKTHKGLKGHCSICKGGCFNAAKRVDVHLKGH